MVSADFLLRGQWKTISLWDHSLTFKLGYLGLRAQDTKFVSLAPTNASRSSNCGNVTPLRGRHETLPWLQKTDDHLKHTRRLRMPWGFYRQIRVDRMGRHSPESLRSNVWAWWSCPHRDFFCNTVPFGSGVKVAHSTQIVAAIVLASVVWLWWWQETKV